MKSTWTRREVLLSALGGELAIPWVLDGQVPARFKVGIITDEISDDLGQALEFLSSYRLKYCELRQLGQANVMNATPETLSRAKQLIIRRRLLVTDIASPVFKYDLPEMPARPEKRDTFRAEFTDQDTEGLLQKSFELARFFGTNKVRIFSYWRVESPDQAFPAVRERLAKAAALAAQNRIVLLLENEHECNIGTGKKMGRILRDINSPYLRGNWDPGNAAMLQEVPFPDGYREVMGLFEHMHIKDVKRDAVTGKLGWASVGSGSIDWRGQLEALRASRYKGTMSLETHYRRPGATPFESTRESLEGLLKILKDVG